jgi:hypothetical protein
VNNKDLKRYAALTAAAGLSTWKIDMAATQVGLPSIQAAMGVLVTASQWILNLALMILAEIVTVGGALDDWRSRRSYVSSNESGYRNNYAKSMS